MFWSIWIHKCIWSSQDKHSSPQPGKSPLLLVRALHFFLLESCYRNLLNNMQLLNSGKCLRKKARRTEEKRKKKKKWGNRGKGVLKESIPPLQKALDFPWKSPLFSEMQQSTIPSGHNSKVQGPLEGSRESKRKWECLNLQFNEESIQGILPVLSGSRAFLDSWPQSNLPLLSAGASLFSWVKALC